MGNSSEDSDKLMAIMSAVSLRSVQRENTTGRRSVSVAGRVTIDETLDLIKVRLHARVRDEHGWSRDLAMVLWVSDVWSSASHGRGRAVFSRPLRGLGDSWRGKERQRGH